MKKSKKKNKKDCKFIESRNNNIFTEDESLAIFFEEVKNKNNFFLESSYCVSCPNSPRNGGSGVCFCILGSPQITC